MKKLSEVTLEDAIAILSVAYERFFKTGKWILEDETGALGEPCKKLSSRYKSYMFWFFDTNMDIDVVNDGEITLDTINFDVKLKCYLKAHELGYNVPEISKFTEDSIGRYKKTILSEFSPKKITQ